MKNKIQKILSGFSVIGLVTAGSLLPLSAQAGEGVAVSVEQHPASAHFSHYVEGIVNPEDLVDITEQDWVIVCSMASQVSSSGKIYAVNRKNEIVLLFDASVKMLPGQETLQTFSPHGIYVSRNKQSGYGLYVINHGSKETIEIFSLNFDKDTPELKWKETITLPHGVWANGLVINSNEQIYISSMYDPTDKYFLEKFERKKVTGQIWKWSRENGWTVFGSNVFSGANGINISLDENSLYLSEWAGQKLHLLDAHDGSIIRSIDLDFLPDNIRWSRSGNLLITGQRGLPKQVFLSQGISETNMYFSVIEVNPTLTHMEKLIDGGNIHFANATVTIDVGQYYWVGCVQNDKIAVYSKK